MSDEEFTGSINFAVESSLMPWEGGFWSWLIEVEGQVRISLDDDEDVVAGTATLTIIKLADALRAGATPYEVFDYSEALATAYTDLFDTRGRLRRRHKIDRAINDMLYIDTVRLNRGFRRARLLAQVIETAIATLAPASLVFAYASDLNKHGLNWHHHGFRPAGRTGVILRDNLDVDPEDLATWSPPDDFD